MDEHGLEQGGCNCSDLYRIYGNILIKTLQKSAQGVDSSNVINVSCVGQADDICLLSNDIHCLYNLLHLALTYCQEYQAELCADKTKLLVATRNDQLWIYFNPISINCHQIPFSPHAEHLGVIRSADGNLAHLLNKILNHKKAKGAFLSSGTAHSRRENPAASVKLEKIYALPVLLSGVASLHLNTWEINIIEKNTLNGLLKLFPGTPQAFTYFMAGSLPGKALLHLRQLSQYDLSSTR